MSRGTAFIDAGKERVKDNANYDMTMSELRALTDTALHDDLTAALGDAYYLGVEVGARMVEETLTA